MVGNDLRVLMFLFKRADPSLLSLSGLHLETGVSYAWLLLCVRKLNGLGLVVLRREGRTIWISLSESGRVVANNLVMAQSYFVKKKEVM